MPSLCPESAYLGCDYGDGQHGNILKQAFEAAQTFQPMNDGQVQTLLDKTAEPGARGEFEPFKTSSIFDGTAQHPDWLGEEPQRLQQLMSAAG
jgi:hypothetical protein